LGARETVFSIRGEVLMRADVISPRSWNFNKRLLSLAPSQRFSEVPHTAVFISGVEILAIFVDRESGRVLSRAWNCLLLIVLQVNFERERVGSWFPQRLQLVIARSWIFIVNCFNKRSCDHHIVPTHAKCKASLFVGGNFFGDAIGIRWGRLR
jgi:hypothetical protein